MRKSIKTLALNRKPWLALALVCIALVTPLSAALGDSSIKLAPALHLPAPTSLLTGIQLTTPTPIAQSRGGAYLAPSADWFVYLPLVLYDDGILRVNTQDRQSVLNFYNQYYLGSEGVAPGWTGDISTCNPGTTSAAFKEAVLMRINYFRAMAGVPATVTFNATYNTKAQAAALIMAANGSLNHTPPPYWDCYTAAGAEGAANSNLAMGDYGYYSIAGYMEDPGGYNTDVGHRRWILYPQTQQMGTGDIPSGWGFNALWVQDDNIWGPRPDTRDGYVAWPPPGYVPNQVVYPRWSFSYLNADFSQTTVTMTKGGSGVSLNIVARVSPPGYYAPENTIVWEPAISLPSTDTTYTVSLAKVKIGGANQSFSYNVTIFDAAP